MKKVGVEVKSIHGDKLQEERNVILREFLEEKFPILISTGLLGRGMDLLNVNQVINFDMSTTIEQYQHQIGRVGRRGKKGLAISFVNLTSKSLLPALYTLLSISHAHLPVELSRYASQKSLHSN